MRGGLFAQGLILGYDGDYLERVGHDWEDGSTTGSISVLIFKDSGPSPTRTGDAKWFTTPGGDMPALSTGRFGGAVFLPGVNGGLYVNLGEAIDFLCGIVDYDLMNDDGYPKFFTPEAGEAGETPDRPETPDAPDTGV